jgi:hypothetical protein
MHHLETSIADPFGDAMTSVMELPQAHLHLFTLFFGYLGATQPQRNWRSEKTSWDTQSCEQA